MSKFNEDYFKKSSYLNHRDFLKKYKFNEKEEDFTEGRHGKVYYVFDKSGFPTHIIKKQHGGGKFCGFVKELSILKSVEHPNISQISNWTISGKNFYFAQPYGIELADYVKYLKDNKEKITDVKNKLYKIFNDIYSAIKFLHSKNIVHLDIKLDNFIYDFEKDKVKLIDFGSATYGYRYQNGLFTFGEDGYILEYKDPEFNVLKYNNSRSDYYSMGIVFLKVFLIFDGVNIEYQFNTELMKDLKDPKDQTLKSVIDKCIEPLSDDTTDIRIEEFLEKQNILTYTNGKIYDPIKPKKDEFCDDVYKKAVSTINDVLVHFEATARTGFLTHHIIHRVLPLFNNYYIYETMPKKEIYCIVLSSFFLANCVYGSKCIDFETIIKVFNKNKIKVSDLIDTSVDILTFTEGVIVSPTLWDYADSSDKLPLYLNYVMNCEYTAYDEIPDENADGNKDLIGNKEVRSFTEFLSKVGDIIKLIENYDTDKIAENKKELEVKNKEKEEKDGEIATKEGEIEELNEKIASLESAQTPDENTDSDNDKDIPYEEIKTYFKNVAILSVYNQLNSTDVNKPIIDANVITNLESVNTGIDSTIREKIKKCPLPLGPTKDKSIILKYDELKDEAKKIDTIKDNLIGNNDDLISLANIYNLGTFSCYCDSITNMLFSMGQFRSDVFHIPLTEDNYLTDEENKKKYNIINSLKSIFTELGLYSTSDKKEYGNLNDTTKTAKYVIERSPYIRSIIDNIFGKDDTTQNSADELLIKIFDSIDEYKTDKKVSQMSGSIPVKEILNSFSYYEFKQIKCKNRVFTPGDADDSIQKEKHLLINLNLNLADDGNSLTIKELFGRINKIEDLDEKNKFTRCVDLDPNDYGQNIYRYILHKDSKYAIFRIIKEVYESPTKTRKANININFEDSIKIDSFKIDIDTTNKIVDESLNPDNIENKNFSFFGAILYNGDASNGHYWYVRKFINNKTQKQYVKYNDLRNNPEVYNDFKVFEKDIEANGLIYVYKRK
jgi:serine/threonine protein kinase